MAAKCVLKLYVTGQTANSQRALRNLQDFLNNELKGVYELEVIDVLKHPQLAEDDKILATPTLAKILPAPVRKIIGDLSDKELGGEMRRLLSVLKQRGSMHKKELTEYEIGPKGLNILGPFEGVENLMSGSARRVEIRFNEEEAEREFIKESTRGMI